MKTISDIPVLFGLAVTLMVISGQVQAQETTSENYINKQAVQQMPLRARVREASGKALQETLSELIAQRHAIQQAHWNIVGQNFYQLHDMTGDHYEALNDIIDVVAERKRALGMAAAGSPSAVANSANLTDIPAGLLNGPQLVSVLAERSKTISDRLHNRISTVGEQGDHATQDLLIDVASIIEKQLWMYRAHMRPVQ
jgi:starvation-inducible DNA-binding protein